MKRSEAMNIRRSLDSLISKIVDTPSEINANLTAIRVWRPGIFTVGDVRLYEGIPYKCVQAHDSSDNSTWTPEAVPALWMQYHGTTAETARLWIAPTGSHDIYKIGEFMIWTDDNVYECLIDTNYNPSEYAQAWSLVST